MRFLGRDRTGKMLPIFMHCCCHYFGHTALVSKCKTLRGFPLLLSAATLVSTGAWSTKPKMSLDDLRWIGECFKVGSFLFKWAMKWWMFCFYPRFDTPPSRFEDHGRTAVLTPLSLVGRLHGFKGFILFFLWGRLFAQKCHPTFFSNFCKVGGKIVVSDKKPKSWWRNARWFSFFPRIQRLPDHLVNLESHQTPSTNQPPLDVNSLFNSLPACLIPLVTWAYLWCTGDAGRCLKRFTTPTSRHWMSCYLRSRESDSEEHKAMTATAASYKMRRTPTCSELGGNHAEFWGHLLSVDLNLQSPKRGDKKVDFQIVVVMFPRVVKRNLTFTTCDV